jgi:hypothetical protein
MLRGESVNVSESVCGWGGGEGWLVGGGWVLWGGGGGGQAMKRMIHEA